MIKADNRGSQDQSKSGAGVDKLEQPDNSHIQKTIAVASGKGGVGKSSVSALLASEIRKRGFKVGILDADVTGPSIPKLFGLKGVPSMLGSQLLPEISASSIRVMSLNLLLEN